MDNASDDSGETTSENSHNNNNKLRSNSLTINFTASSPNIEQINEKPPQKSLSSRRLSIKNDPVDSHC